MREVVKGGMVDQGCICVVSGNGAARVVFGRQRFAAYTEYGYERFVWLGKSVVDWVWAETVDLNLDIAS